MLPAILRNNSHKTTNTMTAVSNMQAFEKLVGICTGFGGKYNPGRQNLRVENLSDILMQARNKMLQASVTKTDYENAQNDREDAFNDIRALASRILAELKSTGATPQTIEDAAAVVRKIRGQQFSRKSGIESASVNSEPVTQIPARKPVSGKNFGTITANLEKLIQTLATEPMYQPANAELQLNALQAKLAELRRANAAVVKTYSDWMQARMARTEFFSEGVNSLHSIAMAVKQQVKATFGFGSEAHAAVLKIRFTKLYGR